MRRLWRALAGEDGPGKTALPLGEFLHPVPLAALAILIVNDHLLKGRGPGWLTGKLSDFAGVLFFPLLLTALGDVIACAVGRLTGAQIDYSLRRWKLLAAMGVTTAIMLGLELSASFGREFTWALGRLGVPSATTRDPWDLVALAMLVPAYAIGLAEIRRVPLARIEVIGRTIEAYGPNEGLARKLLADVKQVRDGDRAVDGLAAACEAQDEAAIWRIMRQIRASSR
jgi:hypothetical protein